MKTILLSIVLFLFSLLMLSACGGHISSSASSYEISTDKRYDELIKGYEELGKKQDELNKQMEETHQQKMTFLENGFNTLDESYRNLQITKKEADECRTENLIYEGALIDLLSTDQLELFSKLQKALIAQSLADTKLNYDKLFATFDFEQSIAYKDYNESLFVCAAITKNHQNTKAEFEEKKKDFIKVIKVIHSRCFFFIA